MKEIDDKRIFEKNLTVTVERFHYLDQMALEYASQVNKIQGEETDQVTRTSEVNLGLQDCLAKNSVPVDEQDHNSAGNLNVGISKFNQYDSETISSDNPELENELNNSWESDVSNSDDFLYCYDCSVRWNGDCPIHGPLIIVEDVPVPLDANDPTRAQRTVPKSLFVDVRRYTPGRGVWAREDIPTRMRFGPYEGEILPVDACGIYGWLIGKNGEPRHCVDASKPGLSNWMRYVKCAQNYGERNLDAFQFNGKIYYRTCQKIPKYGQLRVWYGDDVLRGSAGDPADRNELTLKGQMELKLAFQVNEAQNEETNLAEADSKADHGAQSCLLNDSVPEDEKAGNKRSLRVRKPIFYNLNGKTKSSRNRDDSKNSVQTSDDFLYCFDCSKGWEGDCPLHGPLLIVPDLPVPLDINDPTRAVRTVPSLATVADSKIPGAGKGVWALQNIPARVRFGPYEGQIVPIDANGTAYDWMIRKHGKPSHCVDASEPGLSNWLRYVNCARYFGEQNLEAFQLDGNIYYRTCRRVLQHEELLVWYGDDFGQEFGVDPDDQNGSTLKEVLFKCMACPLACTSPVSLKRHESLCKYARALKLRRETFKRMREEMNEVNDVPVLGDCDSIPVSQYAQCEKNTGTDWTEPISGDGGTSKSVAKKPRPPRRGTYACPICQRIFWRNWTLQIHIKTHTGEKSTICKTCGKTFVNKSSLTSHEKIHSDRKPYVCSICECRFKRSRCFRTHVDCVHNAKPRKDERQYACTECPKRFNSNTGLQKHLRVHIGEKPYVCSTCDGRFSTSTALRQHFRTHSGEKPYACDVCGRSFAHSSTLRGHKQTHTGRLKYPCPECGKIYFSPSARWVHLKTHTEGKAPGCVKCKRQFKDEESPQEHQCIEYTCQKCAKCFYNIKTFKQHLVYHSEGKRAPCPVCKISFHKYYLPSHMIVHTRERPYACSECKRTFARTYELTAHMRLHTGEMPYECKECGKLFAQSQIFYNHVKSHNKNRTVTCAECNKQFASTMTLKSHIMSIHRVLKPFACSYGKCDRRFNRKILLDDHVRTRHTKEAPFSCADCGDRFCTKDLLRIHSRRGHRNFSSANKEAGLFVEE